MADIYSEPEVTEDNSEVTGDDILASLGVAPEEPEGFNAEGAASDQEPDSDPGSEQESTDTDSANANTAEQQQPQQQQPDNTKQNQAFARLRTENAQYQRGFGKLAEILGVPANTPIDVINQRLTEALAKKQGIDPMLAQRLENLEDVNRRYQEQQATGRVEAQFRTIQSKFHVSNDDLRVFAQGLIESNIDVHAPNLDLVSMYISQHFDTILQNERDAAVKAEQERSSKAGVASKPTNKVGKPDNNEEREINSVADLEDFFNKQ